MVLVSLEFDDNTRIASAECDPCEVPVETMMYLSKHDMTRVRIVSNAIEAVVWKNPNGTFSTSWRLRGADTTLYSFAIVTYNETQVLEWCLTVSSLTWPKRINQRINPYPVADCDIVPSTPYMTEVVPSGVV